LPKPEASPHSIELMAKRLINTRLKSNGVRYRVEVIDLLGQGLDRDHNVEFAVPGVSIRYSGNTEDHTNPVISSSAQFTVFLTQQQRDEIMSIMYSDSEYGLVCGIYITDDQDVDRLEWCGLVLPDETSETVDNGSGYITATFSCTDGLPFLKHVNFVTPDTQKFYIGERSLSFWIRECLKKLPHWNYYFAATDQTYLKEIGLPIPSDNTYSFDATASTLDLSYVHARTFYGVKKKLNTRRRLPLPSDTFTSTYEVLSDIMLAVGATLVLTKGCWYAYNASYMANYGYQLESVPTIKFLNVDQEPYFIAQSGEETLLIDLEDEKMSFLTGVNRSGLFPYRGASMIHEDAGSDLIFASGVGYEYGSWDGDEPILNEPIFRVPLWTAWGDPDEEPYQMSYLGRNENEPSVTGLSVAAGDTGGLTVAMSGYLSFERVLLLDEAARDGIGACPIVRNVIRVTDSNGKNWRLKRHVKTLDSFYSSIEVSSLLNALGLPLFNGQDIYYPKFYENGGAYTWVGDDDPEYGDTYFETMIGMDPDIIKEGSTERFLEIDFPSTKFYTPVKTEIKENNEGSDNVLSVRHNDDRTRYLWHMNYTLSMPFLEIGFIEAFHWDSHQLLIYAPNTGPRPHGDGTYTFSQTPAFATAPAPGVDGIDSWNKYKPNEYNIYGCTVKYGNGESTSDLQYLAFDLNNNGSEMSDLGGTRIGSSFVNRNQGSNGKIRSRLFDQGVPLDDREDNLYWSPRYAPAEKNNALLYLNCSEVMHIRHKTRQLVMGSIINSSYGSQSYDKIVRPISILKTSVLRGIDEYLMPYAVNRTFESVSFESIVVGFDRDALLEQIDSYSNNTDTGKGPSTPGVNDNSNDGPGPISNIKNLLIETNGTVSINSQKISDNEFDIANVSQAVNQVISKTDLIIVSSPVNLDNISIPDLGDIEIFTIFLEK